METRAEQLLRWGIITCIVLAIVAAGVFIASKINPIGYVQHRGHTYLTYQDQGLEHDPDCGKCAMENSPFFKKHTTSVGR